MKKIFKKFIFWLLDLEEEQMITQSIEDSQMGFTNYQVSNTFFYIIHSRNNKTLNKSDQSQEKCVKFLVEIDKNKKEELTLKIEKTIQEILEKESRKGEILSNIIKRV